MALNVTSKLFQEVAPDLFEEFREKKTNPAVSKEERVAFVKTDAFITRKYASFAKKRFEEFLETLDHSPSLIDRTYAKIQREVLLSPNDDTTIPETFEALKIFIDKQGALALDLKASAQEVQDNVCRVSITLEKCKKHLAQLSSEVPETYPLYRDFMESYTAVQQKLTTLETNISRFFVSARIILASEDKEECAFLFKSFILQFLDMVEKTIFSVQEVVQHARTIKMFTLSPIERHIQVIDSLSLLLLNPSQQQQAASKKSLLEEIEVLQKEEPELAELYASLQKNIKLVQKNPLGFICTANTLKEKLNEKIHYLLQSCSTISRESVHKTSKILSAKIEKGKRCQNPACPLEKEDVQASKKLLVPLQKCARCQTALYCSKECQREDWPRHKIECLKSK